MVAISADVRSYMSSGGVAHIRARIGAGMPIRARKPSSSRTPIAVRLCNSRGDQREAPSPAGEHVHADDVPVAAKAARPDERACAGAEAGKAIGVGQAVAIRPYFILRGLLEHATRLTFFVTKGNAHFAPRESGSARQYP